jgi:hypothetical protein
MQFIQHWNLALLPLTQARLRFKPPDLALNASIRSTASAAIGELSATYISYSLRRA